LTVNTGVNRLAVVSSRYCWLDWLLVGSSGQVIDNGVFVNLWKYGVRKDEIDHAVHLQSGDSVDDVKDGELTPTGQLILTLIRSAQGATYGDVERILARLDVLESRLSADPRPPTSVGG
jgi:hypothetical protein